MLTQTRQLETERQKYQTLFETNSDAVVILDDKGFTDCNPATLSLFGMDSVADFPQARRFRNSAPPSRPTAWPPRTTPCSTSPRRAARDMP